MVGNNTQKTEHFMNLVRDFKFAIMTSKSLQGTLHGRPMVIAHISPNADIVFATDLRTDKVEELCRDANVSVSMQDGQKFVSLGGQAEIVRDAQKVQQLWSEAWKVWFPKGPTDPDLVLIKVKPTIGEYWDNSGTEGVKFLFEAVKAYVQGRRPQADQDVQGKVQLSH